MALTRLFVHDTFYDATDNFTYTPGMRLTLDNTTQSARITRLQNSGVVSTDETIDPSGVAITGGNIDGTVIGATTAAAGTFTTITVDTTTLVTDAANNRVGIGTASPTYNLHVRGTTARIAVHADTPTNPLLIEHNSSGDASVLLASAGTLSIGVTNDSASDRVELLTRNVSRVVIDNAGNVGIGTTSPSVPLDVVGGNGTIQKVSTTSNTGRIQVEAVTSPSIRFDATGGTDYTVELLASYSDEALRLLGGSGYKVLTTAGFSTPEITRLYSNNTLAVTIDAGQNVGIGTASANRRLTVRSSAANTTVLAVQNNDNTSEMFTITETSSKHGRLNLRNATNTANVEIHSSGSSYFNGGNVGIGTTSPDDKLHVTGGNVRFGGFDGIGASGTTDGVHFTFDGAIASSRNGNAGLYLRRRTSDGTIAIFRRDTTTVGSISITTTATSYNTSSDERLKRDIVPAGDALAFLRETPVDEFTWKADGSHMPFGYVAQKLNTYAPYAVTTGDTPSDMWSVDHSKLVPALHRAIQQLDERINALKAV